LIRSAWLNSAGSMGLDRAGPVAWPADRPPVARPVETKLVRGADAADPVAQADPVDALVEQVDREVPEGDVGDVADRPVRAAGKADLADVGEGAAEAILF
jgi:hypothetical protein